MQHTIDGQDDEIDAGLQEARLLAQERVATQQGRRLDAEFVGDPAYEGAAPDIWPTKVGGTEAGARATSTMTGACAAC